MAIWPLWLLTPDMLFLRLGDKLIGKNHRKSTGQVQCDVNYHSQAFGMPK